MTRNIENKCFPVLPGLQIVQSGKNFTHPVWSSLPLLCRDFSSGYLVAEIFSRYYPQDFPEHSYDKGTSLSAKQKNWSRMERVGRGKTTRKYNEEGKKTSSLFSSLWHFLYFCLIYTWGDVTQGSCCCFEADHFCPSLYRSRTCTWPRRLLTEPFTANREQPSCWCRRFMRF